MKSAVKWSAIVLIALIVVGIGALLVIPNFIDVNRYKPEVERYVLEATGRPLSVGGDVRLSLFPWAGLSFSDLRLGNPPAFVEKDFLAVKSFEVRVKLWPLLFRQVEVDRLVVNGPVLSLIANKDGGVSWDFGSMPAQSRPSSPAEKETQAGLPIASLLVSELHVRNGRILVIDHARESRQEISELNVALRDVSFDRPVRLALSAALNQKPVSAEGRFGPVGRNPGLDPVPLEFTVDAFGLLKLNVTGTLENLLGEPLARIDAEAAEFSPRRLLAEIGQPLPPTADPTVLERASFKASMRAGTQAVTVSDAVLNLDDSKLVFSVKVTEFSKPGLAFDLNLDRIDIDRYLAPQSTPAEQKAGPSRPKTDYTPLRKLVLDGNARIGRLTVARAQAEDVNLKIGAREGILAIDPISMKLYRGTAVGKTAVNFKGERPATEVEVQLDNVQVNPLLKDILDEDFLEGAAQTRLALSARGEDPARIKQSLNGKGSLTLSDGAIVGVDLAAMVRNLKATLGGKVRTGAKPRTDFSELIVPFTIENGVFHTPETLLKSPLMRLQATGKADLVRETLDFRVDPKLVGTIKGQGDEKERAGLGVPLIVSGTFASPIVGPDVAALAQDRLKKALGPSAPVKEKTSELIRSLQPGKK